MRYAWIQDHTQRYSVTMMCDVLDVSPSGYYDWLDRPPSARAQRRERITQAAAAFHSESHGIYGYRKVHQDLLDASDVELARSRPRLAAGRVDRRQSAHNRLRDFRDHPPR